MTQTYFEFIENLNSQELINYCFSVRLLKDIQTCTTCNVDMQLKKCTDTSDQYNWRCLNTSCVKYQTTKSIRFNSFFWKSGVSIKKILITIYFYSTGIKQNEIISITNLSRNFVHNFRRKLITKMNFILRTIRLGLVDLES
jgi:hypothetical protein